MTNINQTGEAFENAPVSARVKIAGLWTSTLFIFAYVDIFALLRADFVEGVLAGKVAVFSVNQTFLLLTTIYVIVPSLMIFLSLVLSPKVNRWANIILAVFYALTILGGSIGETWIYYLVGSGVEVLLLIAIVWHACKMP